MRRIASSAMVSDSHEHEKPAPLPWDSLERSARKYYRAGPLERIRIIRQRVPAVYIRTITLAMNMSKETLYGTLNLARATIDRKVQKKELLNQDESERVLAITRLVGHAESIVRDSGVAEGFRAAEWVSTWLQHPHPALGGKRPGELMDTADGRDLVTDLLARQQSGAYV